MLCSFSSFSSVVLEGSSQQLFQSFVTTKWMLIGYGRQGNFKIDWLTENCCLLEPRQMDKGEIRVEIWALQLRCQAGCFVLWQKLKNITCRQSLMCNRVHLSFCIPEFTKLWKSLLNLVRNVSSQHQQTTHHKVMLTGLDHSMLSVRVLLTCISVITQRTRKPCCPSPLVPLRQCSSLMASMETSM